MGFSAAPIASFPSSNPNIDGTVLDTEIPPEDWAANLGDPHYTITVEWSWPMEEWWSSCRVVRSTRSPCRRPEEGQTMAEHLRNDWPTYSGESGRPCYVDVQPPPREWTFYTLFFMDSYRVWKYGGAVGEIGIGDFDWTLRLPEFLPGAAVSNAVGVTHPADQYNPLVTFLQAPGTFMDAGVTMGETAQYFWDPLRVPPHGVPHLARSWGYRYDETLGLGRYRDVLEALKQPAQGSLPVIQQLVDAVVGNPTAIHISHNWMLDINDSSFESGEIIHQGWGPLRTDTLQSGTSLQIYDHSGQVTLPPNVAHEHYMLVPAAASRTIKCGYVTTLDENGDPVMLPGEYPPGDEGCPTQTYRPIERGVPIQGWTVARMGMYARVAPTKSADITMSLDLHDQRGIFIANMPVLATRALTTDWAWYGNGDGKGAEVNNDPAKKYCVPITVSHAEQLPADVLTSASNWTAGGSPTYSIPQTGTPPVAQGSPAGMKFTWNANPATLDTGIAAWGVNWDKFTGPAIVLNGAAYIVSMTVVAATGAAPWRPVVLDEASSLDYTVPDDAPWTMSFEWKSGSTLPLIGIEVKKSGSWGTAGEHLVTAFSLIRKEEEPVYGVPVITVSQTCDIDLIQVDDG